MNPKNLFEENFKRTILIVILSVLAGLQSLAGSIAPVNLECEYRENPLGIDALPPRLNWQVQSGERDQGQTAYEILVASSAEILQQDQGNLWASRRIAGDETANIAYSGKPLTSGAQCFWKVRAWEKNGRPSEWSTPAHWSMGLLAPQDWQGKWIGLDSGEGVDPLEGAKWIWFPEGNPAASAPVGTRYFRRVFEFPAGQTVRTATVTMTADNEYRLFVNGQAAGGGSDWRQPGKIAIGAFLKTGKNVLAVQVRNVGDAPTPAGLIGNLNVVFESGNPLTLATDGSWKSAVNREDG